uniref:Uncharacterized protein n=1 Tax=Rhizophora mucronata TaxID=61149 RepID=A0A2P2KBQ6_RHIMU
MISMARLKGTTVNRKREKR